MNTNTEIFLSTVKNYCLWVELPPLSIHEEIREAIHLVSKVYTQALLLPETETNDGFLEIDISNEEWNTAFKRFTSFPFNYYLDFFAPYQIEENQAGLGDLADDLADIYRDLKEGLMHYESGNLKAAIWTWKWTFNSHWGRHAVSALNALHCYAVDNNIPLQKSLS